MDFGTAIKTCLHNYATFRGRAARSEYWWFVLFMVLASIVLSVIDTTVFGFGHVTRGPDSMAQQSNGGPLTALFTLAVLLPALAVAVRRLHDVGKSGWWLLLQLVPLIGSLVLLYFFVQPSDNEANAFGPAPGKMPPLR